MLLFSLTLRSIRRNNVELGVAAVVLLALFLFVQRDPRFFAEPERFSPERWADDLAKRLPTYAYFPFGGGPRLCIGNCLALMEATLILATLAQRFRFELATDAPILPAPSMTLRPDRQVMLRLVGR